MKIASVDRAGHMLAVGRHKLRGAAPPTVQGCALVLPFRSATFEGATMAFGLRNLPDADAGVAEARRVLKPGARLVILEFVHPAGALARASHLFGVRFLVPVVGGLIGGDPGAYRYLARSIEAFLDLDGVARLVSAHGFRVLERRLLPPRGPAALVVAEAIA